MAGIENLLGGFAKGIALGRNQRLALERQAKNDELSQAYTKVLTANAKTKQEQMKLAQQVMGLLPTPPKSAGGTLMPDDTVVEPTTTAPAKPAAGGEGLLDMLSNPLQAIFMQMATGMDFPEAAKMGMTQQKNQFDMSEKMARLMLRLTDVMPGVNVTNDDGSVTRQYPYRYPNMVPGKEYGDRGPIKFAFDTQPATMQQPIKPADLPFYIHGESLQPAPPGLSPAQAESLGYKRVTAADKSRIADFSQTKVLATRIFDIMGKVFPQQETFFQRFTGGLDRAWGAWTQTDPDAALLKSMLDGTQAAFVRMFEKGTLTDQDIARAKKMNINLWDKADVAWAKINNMMDFIKELQQSFLGGGKRPGKAWKQLTDKERKALLSTKAEDPAAAREDKELESILFDQGD